MKEPVTAYVGLGANLGDAAATVLGAVEALAALPRTTLVARSSLYRTAPVQASGPDFVNAVAALHTRLDAPGLLAALQGIEAAAGRERPYRNAPRTLDLDLLLYGQGRIDSARLTVPHPRMSERAFVLVPLAEIAPQLVPAGALAAMTSQVVARMP
ncbi:MAG TPA: 2-amino-4-hydroxy-6-hydroxymethyldihydropteridine diphosphokinase [Ramlibacter sp.]|jgi:2-amino-4-hydroxy-6-hydroxymethyldihydropteridine diphosphokinase|uniref:2-amino-4-hydroxy-6- hydroxymethyldihydropteridine diphosphokinase n=1 Tax=Ramlibacter sp. TaxID=1917967 RepID=UPI002D2535B0|nr:2-amino-4-hydroxy-6-hydroxymethyldihydropteridine diphosphokinase [Ramlibacter sp.]HZY20398.1 2-amino-4-hydroxy-6-hydroxymethyldihydropteridine diphosphokinase [Ramlibacter sp.]